MRNATLYTVCVAFLAVGAHFVAAVPLPGTLTYYKNKSCLTLSRVENALVVPRLMERDGGPSSSSGSGGPGSSSGSGGPGPSSGFGTSSGSGGPENGGGADQVNNPKRLVCRLLTDLL
ncbi:hypothetical protein K439DRAFT_1628475 [Ramaria rubella]|nr:hypothetical protein K439DRAFT_1628475 [Ramaria rubella]